METQQSKIEKLILNFYKNSLKPYLKEEAEIKIKDYEVKTITTKKDVEISLKIENFGEEDLWIKPVRITDKISGESIEISPQDNKAFLYSDYVFNHKAELDLAIFNKSYKEIVEFYSLNDKNLYYADKFKAQFKKILKADYPELKLKPLNGIEVLGENKLTLALAKNQLIIFMSDTNEYKSTMIDYKDFYDSKYESLNHCENFTENVIKELLEVVINFSEVKETKIFTKDTYKENLGVLLKGFIGFCKQTSEQTNKDLKFNLEIGQLNLADTDYEHKTKTFNIVIRNYSENPLLDSTLKFRFNNLFILSDITLFRKDGQIVKLDESNYTKLDSIIKDIYSAD